MKLTLNNGILIGLDPEIAAAKKERDDAQALFDRAQTDDEISIAIYALQAADINLNALIRDKRKMLIKPPIIEEAIEEVTA